MVRDSRATCEWEPRGDECDDRDLFPAGFADELEAHWVTLDDYWLDRTEVTNSEYRVCVS